MMGGTNIRFGVTHHPEDLETEQASGTSDIHFRNQYLTSLVCDNHLISS